jgi:Skp family chaperone for outer membrane proteins
MYRLLKNSPIIFQIQEELKGGMTLEQTAAGAQLSADLDFIIKKHEAEIQKVHEEMEEAAMAKDESWQELNGELAKLKEEVTRLTANKEQLKKRPYVPVSSTRTQPH